MNLHGWQLAFVLWLYPGIVVSFLMWIYRPLGVPGRLWRRVLWYFCVAAFWFLLPFFVIRSRRDGYAG